MEKISAVAVLVVSNSGKVLVLHRLLNLPEGGKWGAPGGKVREKLGSLGTIQMKTELEGINANLDDFKLLDRFEYTVDVGVVAMEAYVLQLGVEEFEVSYDREGHDAFMWDLPRNLLDRDDLMVGMYPILRSYINQL